MARAQTQPSPPPPIVDGGMERFYVGDYAEIKNEGLHGFKEGVVGIIAEVNVQDNLGNAGYKLDVTDPTTMQTKARYIDEKDLRKPKKEPKPLPAEEQLTAEAKLEPTLVKAKAMSQRQAREVREAKEKKDQIARGGRGRADASIIATSKAETKAGTRKVPAVVKARAEAGSLAKAKAESVNSVKPAQDPTVKKLRVVKPKGSVPAKAKVKAIKPAKVIKAVKTAKAIKTVVTDPKAGKVKGKAVKSRKR